MSDDSIFKKCPKCQTVWKTRNDFLTDPSLRLNGYQACIESLQTGLILFTHMKEDCGSTMSTYVHMYDDLYDGPRYSENRALQEECPRYCINKDMLERCDAICECAYVREIVHSIDTIFWLTMSICTVFCLLLAKCLFFRIWCRQHFLMKYHGTENKLLTR